MYRKCGAHSLIPRDSKGDYEHLFVLKQCVVQAARSTMQVTLASKGTQRSLTTQVGVRICNGKWGQTTDESRGLELVATKFMTDTSRTNDRNLLYLLTLNLFKHERPLLLPSQILEISCHSSQSIILESVALTKGNSPNVGERSAFTSVQERICGWIH